jgi:hypothetical protein
LRQQGFGYQQIADQIQRGFNEAAALTGGTPRTYSSMAAWKAVQRHQAEMPVEDRQMQRQLGADRLEELYQAAKRIYVSRHYVVSTTGRVVTGPDGTTPLEDHGPKLAAVREMRALEESRRKLFALDAKPSLNTFSEDDADTLLAALQQADATVLEIADADEDATV